MMVGNALLVTIAILLGYLFWLMGELKFIAPYKVVLFHAYGNIALGWLGLLFLNVFAAVYLIGRKFFLKDAGRKLWHVDIEANRGLLHVPRLDVDEELF
jgi:Na+/phosphate symporter